MIGLSSEEKRDPPIPANAVRHSIRFVQKLADGQTVLMEFVDPVPTKAVRVHEPDAPGADDALDVLVIPGQPNDDPTALDQMMNWVLEAQHPGLAPPITITLHGTQLIWHSRRVAILAAPERMESLLLAVVDFGFYEKELARLERITAESWPQLDADSPLMFEVTAKDLERGEGVRQQLQRMLNVRMRHARLVPRLCRPGTLLASLANQLGERLREKACVEVRLEILASQLEVFERVYEMSSQRFSEFRTSKKETTLEWVIIILLAAETVVLLIDLLLNLDRK
jgi:hypothetical protein